MPEFALPEAIVLIVAIVVALATVWLLNRPKAYEPPRGRALHAMSRDETVGYFRDPSATSNAPGIQEEDLDHHWGEKG